MGWDSLSKSIFWQNRHHWVMTMWKKYLRHIAKPIFFAKEKQSESLEKPPKIVLCKSWKPDLKPLWHDFRVGKCYFSSANCKRRPFNSFCKSRSRQGCQTLDITLIFRKSFFGLNLSPLNKSKMATPSFWQASDWQADNYSSNQVVLFQKFSLFSSAKMVFLKLKSFFPFYSANSALSFPRCHAARSRKEFRRFERQQFSVANRKWKFLSLSSSSKPRIGSKHQRMHFLSMENLVFDSVFVWPKNKPFFGAQEWH